jgi:predicted metal-dependent peptidase
MDERSIAQAAKRMEWLMGFMIVRYHFVYQILALMTKECVPKYDTMGVAVLSGGQFKLVYGPDFVNSLSDAHLTYVMYHEVLHLALHHCTHRKFDLHELGNIAHDLAVNELIPINPGSCEPPMKDGKLMGIFVSELKKMKEYSDIKEKQTAEWYYDYLRKKQKEQAAAGGNGKDQSGKQFDNHGGWSENEVADEKIRAKIDEIAKSNTWGNVGSVEKELILAAQTRRINWRNILRQFYGNMVWHERESTRKRPNRRTGLIHPGAKKIQLDRHLVVVDTSGSIDSDLLAQFLSIINQMTDFVPIDIMQCDCEVTEPPRPFDRRRKEFTFKGRGGTSFQPIMDMVDERHYKSVVILTDGEAAECSQPHAKVVWVLPEGKKPPVEWGMKVIMSRHV